MDEMFTCIELEAAFTAWEGMVTRQAFPDFFEMVKDHDRHLEDRPTIDDSDDDIWF